MKTNRELLIEKANVFRDQLQWTGLDGMGAGEIFNEVHRRFTEIAPDPIIAAEARKLADLCEKYRC